MLITTTPFLPGRIYREVDVVAGGSRGVKRYGRSAVAVAYPRAIAMLEDQAQRAGGNAVIGVHPVVVACNYVLLVGTAIVLEPDMRSEDDRRHMWDFLPRLTQDL